ncbi:MAG: DNA cytosine methyltransferase [Bacteroidota bacterium]
MSFFSGCGGSSTGFHMAEDFIEVLAYENNEHAIRSFHLNYPNVPVTNLIGIDKVFKNGKGKKNELDQIHSDLNGEDVIVKANTWYKMMNNDELLNMKIRDLDVLAASPPCQDFSMANTERNFKMNSHKNNLFLETIRLIDEIKPKVAVIENVPGMMRGKMKSIFLQILCKMAKTEYKFSYKILNATKYGVPQSRDRIIFIGVRKDIAKTLIRKESFDASWWPEEQKFEIKKICLKSIVPRAFYYSSGQFDDCLIPASEVVGTITRTASMKFYDEKFCDFDPNIEEVKKLFGFPVNYKLYDSEKQGKEDPATGKPYIDPNSDAANPQEYNRGLKYERLGNSVAPPLMKAIAISIKEKILKPYYTSISENIE